MIKFIDKSLLLEKEASGRKEKILVIADLHIGYEEALNEQGIFLPRIQMKQIFSDLEKIFKQIGKIEEIVILGDLKHEFGSISGQEWRDVLALLDFLQEKCKKIILVKGNHDTILEPIAKKKNNLSIVNYYIEGENAFIHGHKLFIEILDKKVKNLFLGHRHPAVVLRKGAKSESYKCFLVGKWKGKNVYLLPSFFPLVEGSDVFVEDTNLFTKFNLKEFDVYAVGDKVYKFGKLGKFGRLIS